MDTQLKRGLLEACVLTSLLEKDSYGYQLIKDMSEYIVISESTLYPILKRLEISEMLIVYTKEHNGRLRKYYKITDKGKNKLLLFLSEWKEVAVIYNYIKNKENLLNYE